VPAADPPTTSVATSGRTTRDDRERHATSGIDAPAAPKQPGLFDANPPNLIIH
jgi:hypothetical protein